VNRDLGKVEIDCRKAAPKEEQIGKSANQMRNQRLARRVREWERSNQITLIDTDKDRGAWLRLASQAGASESGFLSSELADSPVSESLTRSASIPISIDPFLATLSNI
jgi:hypothetical protein